MEHIKHDLEWNLKAETPLRIIIVGAGIAGLVAAIGLKRSGHDIVILEQVSKFVEVGAGIQMAPNATRILGRFGLLDKILEKANLLEKNSMRRYADNYELGTAPLMPQIAVIYGAPLGVLHRADLQRILLEGAKAENVKIRFDARVVEADPDFEARVKLNSGEWIEGDVVIAADGIKSDIRRQMADIHSVHDQSMPTGDAAYRIIIPKEKLEHDPEALALLESNNGMRWMGPGGHVMAYPIKNNTVYNMVLIHPQQPGLENEESWTTQGDKREMLDFYSQWNDLVKRLISYVPEGEIMEWTLNIHRPLPSWIENKVALIGDACHPMLPYVAQGAAQAIEDAAVLAVCLTLTPHVRVALAIYTLVRKSRGEAIQQSASTTKTALHLPDGPEQEKRDEAIRNARGKEGRGGRNPDLWADREWQDFMWGVDVMRETVERWEEWKERVDGCALEAVGASIVA
ncbi:hypothetical protein MMC06_004402 [Schaereria dolodes]|nr:hypothetical protein [Schaereria dolodes]